MSKQLKYKLKKTLKNAEFVHADLEYHQELSQDALLEFQEAINKLLAILTDEQRRALKDYLDRQPRPTPPRGQRNTRRRSRHYQTMMISAR